MSIVYALKTFKYKNLQDEFELLFYIVFIFILLCRVMTTAAGNKKMIKKTDDILD